MALCYQMKRFERAAEEKETVKMSQRNCYDCEYFLTNVKIISLNKAENERKAGSGDEVWPLDVEWKNCIMGSDVWLNCHKRKRVAEEKQKRKEGARA